MRRIGAHVSIAGGLSNAIINAQKINANCIQIFAGSPRLWARKPFDPNEVASFISLAKKHQIDPVVIHALYLVNLASPNQDIYTKSLQSIIVDMNNGSQINSLGVIIHIGSHLGAGFEAVSSQVVEAIRHILSATKNCDLILENDAGQNGKIGSLEELAFLIGEIKSDRLKVCLDTAHLFESGVNIADPKELHSLVSELKEYGLADKIVCLHLNDSATPLNSHRDMHANLGEGQIGLLGLNSFVNHPVFSSLPIFLEVPGDNKNGPDAKNIKKAQSLVN